MMTDSIMFHETHQADKPLHSLETEYLGITIINLGGWCFMWEILENIHPVF